MQRKTLKRKRGEEQELHGEKKILKATVDENEQNVKKVTSNKKSNKKVRVKLKGSITQNEKHQILPGKHIYPIIPKQKINKLFAVLREERSLNDYEKKMKQCLAHLHTSAKPPWNSPSVILKAMKGCILRRKWENLTQLLFMLLHLPSIKYRPIIRHMCQILDKYHPVIQQKGLHDQFKTISVAHRSMRTGNAKLIA